MTVEWVDPTHLAVAQVTAHLSDFRRDSVGLSRETFGDLVSERGPEGEDPALVLALGLMNLCLLTLVELAKVTATSEEELLQVLAKRLPRLGR